MAGHRELYGKSMKSFVKNAIIEKLCNSKTFGRLADTIRLERKFKNSFII